MLVQCAALLVSLPLASATIDWLNIHPNGPVEHPAEISKALEYAKAQLAVEQLADTKLRLVSTSATEPARWILEEDKDALRRAGIKFMDITDHQDLGKLNMQAMSKAAPYPRKMKQGALVKKYIAELSKEEMKTNLKLLTSFHTRYYKSSYGAASGDFLYNLVQNISSSHDNVTSVKQFKHPWGQHSIIARIQGTESNDTVVIGAHQDSANLFLPTILAAPGADDDGSGTVTILEVFKVLMDQKFVPRNSIEFHWYSAEEGGLLGSQAIFQEYEKKQVPVIAMLEQDMTGYVKGTLAAGKEESMGVVTDFVDKDLTEYVKLVVDTYCSIPYVETKCGYACSDFASATRAGYRSAFVIESEFKLSNKLIHSQNDLIDELSFDHMLEHGKLTTGFAVELGMMKRKKKSKKGRKHLIL